MPSSADTVLVGLPRDVARAVLKVVKDFGIVEGYGFYCGGDPREFHPDPDASTEVERQNHARACDEYVATGKFSSRAWGLGSYRVVDPLLVEAAKLIEEAVRRG